MDCGVWRVGLLLKHKSAAGGQRYGNQKVAAPAGQTKCVAPLLLMDDNAGWLGGSLT